jgi:hypothetical protein
MIKGLTAFLAVVPALVAAQETTNTETPGQARCPL